MLLQQLLPPLGCRDHTNMYLEARLHGRIHSWPVWCCKQPPGMFKLPPQQLVITLQLRNPLAGVLQAISRMAAPVVMVSSM